MDLVERALDVDVTAAASAVLVAAVREADAQADAVLGRWPVPGSPEWAAEDGTDRPVERQRAWQLLQLRIVLGAGLDPLPVLVGLRHHGATWALIARAAGVTRQSAHERWAARVDGLLAGEERTT